MKTKNKTGIRKWISQNKISPRLANVLKHYEFAFNCKDINQVDPAELIQFRNAGKITVKEFVTCRNNS